MSLLSPKAPFSPRRSGPFTSSNQSSKSYDRHNIVRFPYILNKFAINELRLTHNPLKTFEGMTEMPLLETLRIDNTQISSFIGAVIQPKLRLITISNTPLSLYSFHRVMARIAFGDSIQIIGTKHLSQEEKSQAKSFGSAIRDYIVNGWILTSTKPLRIYNPSTRIRKIVFVPDDFVKIRTEFDPIIDFIDPYPPKTRSNFQEIEEVAPIAEVQGTEEEEEVAQQPQIEIHEEEEDNNIPPIEDEPTLPAEEKLAPPFEEENEPQLLPAEKEEDPQVQQPHSDGDLTQSEPDTDTPENSDILDAHSDTSTENEDDVLHLFD